LRRPTGQHQSGRTASDDHEVVAIDGIINQQKSLRQFKTDPVIVRTDWLK
jgi:hypothetical protein